MSEEDLKYLQTEYEENIITELIKKVESLQTQLQQKENIIKGVREYIKEHIKYECDDAFNGKQFYSYHLYDFDKNKLLEILDKGSDKE